MYCHCCDYSVFHQELLTASGERSASENADEACNFFAEKPELSVSAHVLGRVSATHEELSQYEKL